MKLDEFGVGKITAQNTTKDVKPGETQRQAAKFGNKIDKDGKPPLLHKKAAKNSDPNTLMNLGISEDSAYMGGNYKPMTPAEKAEMDKRISAIVARNKKLPPPASGPDNPAWSQRSKTDKDGYTIRSGNQLNRRVITDPEGNLVAKKTYDVPGGATAQQNYADSKLGKAGTTDYEYLDKTLGVKKTVDTKTGKPIRTTAKFSMPNKDDNYNSWKTYTRTVQGESVDSLPLAERSMLDKVLQAIAPKMKPQQYEKAAQALHDVLVRKSREGQIRHSLGYYAQRVGRAYAGIDYRALADYYADTYGTEGLTEDIGKWEVIRGVRYYIVKNKSGKAKAFSGPTPAAKKYAQTGGKYPWESVNEADEVIPMLYHATYRPFLDSIMKNGLGGKGAQTQWEDSKPGYVYLAKDPDVAISHAEANEEVPDEYIDNIVVLSIDASQLDQDNLEDDPNVMDDDSTLAYKGIIPTSAFSVMESLQELKIQKPDEKDTLGIERKFMPQIKTADYPEFIEYLEKNGARFRSETIPAADLKAMQKEFSDAGILKQLEKNLRDGPNTKAVIASSDDYILDGHHRWLVALNTGADLNVYRVNMPAWKLYDLVNDFEKTYYKDIYDEGAPSIGVPLASGLVMKLFPHRPLQIAKSTPGKLRYDETVTQVDIDQLEVFADKLFAKVGIDVEFTRHFLDRVNDERNKKPITMAELTRLFKQEFKRWGKPIAQMGPDAEAVMKDLQTDINLPFVLQYDRENNELDLVAKTVMRKKDFKTPDREFAVEDTESNTIGGMINFPGYENKPIEKDKKPKYPKVQGKDKSILDKVKGWFTTEELDEDLRDWFKEKWVNIGKKNKDGSHPECGTSGKKSGYAKCVPAAKAKRMSKKEKASATRRKRAAQNKKGRGGKDKPGSGKKPIRVSTNEAWSEKYKRSINCSNPKGFSQKAHCAGRKKTEDVELDEGVNDPHIFKAVFLAGGPGSGKSFVAKNLLSGTGLRSVNSDEVYEFLMQKQGLDLDPATIASPKGQEIRDRAKELTDVRMHTYLKGRIGLVIDGTGKDVAKYQKQVEKLGALGYDCMMIFVNTSEDVAQQRNLQRSRSLPPSMVTKMWSQVQDNLMKFQQVFGASRFHIIDNSGGLEDLDRKENFDKVYNETQRFLNTPPNRRAAQRWIQQQQKAQTDATQRQQQQTTSSDGGTENNN